MKVDAAKIMELARTVKPLFLDHEGASRIQVKGVADFVTQVDLQVQEMIQKGLRNLYPDIQFMGEEKDNSEIDFSGAVWILDPVDGTTNLIETARCHLRSVTTGSWNWGLFTSPTRTRCFMRSGEEGHGSMENPSM